MCPTETVYKTRADLAQGSKFANQYSKQLNRNTSPVKWYNDRVK